MLASASLNFIQTSYLYVYNSDEVSGFLQAVESPVLHELSHDLVGDLVSPFVDHWHVDIVNEDGCPLAGRGTVRCTHTLVYVALNGALTVRVEKNADGNGSRCDRGINGYSVLSIYLMVVVIGAVIV